MSDQPVRFTPLGNLDKDSEYKLVGKGNYIDALDIIKQDDAGQVSGTIQPTQRNKHAFSLGSVQAQNKKYRVTVDGDATKSHALRFVSSDNQVAIVNGSGSNNEVEFNGVVSDFLNSWNTQTQQYASFQITTSGNIIEIELTQYSYYNWSLFSVGQDEVQVECIQEAIPTNLTGKLKDIGSYDLLGDLFIFSTTQSEEPSELEAKIINVGPIGNNPTPPPNFILTGPITEITFDSPHGLIQGEQIRIQNSQAAWLNTILIVDEVTSSLSINVVTNTSWGQVYPEFSVGDEVVIINPTGLGEIGVSQKNNQSEQWSYIRLLRSVEFNFVQTKDIRCDGRQKISSKHLYFTDFYNSIRSFKYKGVFEEDGALSFVNSENIYSYGNVNLEVQLSDVSGGIYNTLSLSSVNQTGGQLVAGNYYFFYRFYIGGQSQFWGALPNPVSIYLKDFPDDPIGFIVGDPSTTVTSKSISISLTGVNVNLFDEVEFAVIRAFEDGFDEPLIFTPNRLTATETVNVDYTGYEEEVIPVDIAEFALESLSVAVPDKAYDLSIIDGRLVLGNIKYKDIGDLSDWAEAITHSLKYEEIGISPIRRKDIYESYVKPEIINEYPSVTLNEIYRVGVEVIFSNGVKSPIYWVDDIKIDCESTNTENPNNENRRISGLPNFELTGDVDVSDGNNNQVTKVPYIEFSNINLEYLFGGSPLKNQISDVRFRLADIKNKRSVLASGFVVLGTAGQRISTVVPDASGYTQDGSTGPVDWGITSGLNQSPGDTEIIPNPSFAGWYDYDNPNNTDYAEWDTTEIPYPFDDGYTQDGVMDNNWIPFRKYAYFFSPELTNGDLDNFSLTGADRLNVMYPLKRTGDYVNGDIGDWSVGSLSPRENIFLDYVAKTSFSNPAVSVNEYDIDYYSLLGINQSATNIDPTSPSEFVRNTYGETLTTPASSVGGALLTLPKCMAFKTDQGIYPADLQNIPSEVAKDCGIYYAQLYRDIPDKYGDISDTVYVSQYSSHSVQSLLANSVAKCFLGDAFIYRVINRWQFPSFNSGGAIGLSNTCQSYINTALIFPEPTSMFFDQDTINNWLNSLEEYEWKYNHAYDYRFPIQDSLVYTEELIDSLSDAPARIIFSERDNYAFTVDRMRDIPVANFKDLDGTWGPIFSVNNINGELFTLQPRKYQLQYFNTRGTLQGSNDGIEVLIGDASVLDRDGKSLSSYGTNHEGSVIKGSSPGGKDVIYWFNQENGLFMRFGADGTVVLSERNGIRSFSANNTKWTENQYTPALNYGIRSVWDDRFKEAIWTFIGVRANKGAWGTLPSNQLYSEGATVTGVTFDNYSFDGIPDVYISLSLHFPIPQSEPGVGSDWGTYWKLADKDDPEYYSVFTLAFNELSNGFSTFYSHLPKTYLKWKNKFLSSHPTERSEIYEHRYGYDKWYEYEGAWKESEPYLEGVVNPFPDQSKKFVAIQALTDNVPDRIELITKDHESFLVATDFDPEDDAWRTPIKNDILTSQTSDPNDDTVSLIGSYMRVKFKFFNGAYNKMNNLVVKVRQRLRRTQS